MASATLLGAITTLFQGNAALAAAVPNSPWLDEPLEGTTPPYVVITDLKEESSSLDFERENEVHSRWSFEVYAVGEAAAEAIAGQVNSLFDQSDTATSPMQITNRNLVKVIRQLYDVTLSKTRSTTTQRVTKVTIAFYAEWEEVVP